jgi:hypothetical protein
MPGFDPGIHQSSQENPFKERWITGSSPGMTGGFCGAGKGALRTHANLNIFKQPKNRHCERERSKVGLLRRCTFRNHRHTPPPGLAFGEPGDGRRRAENVRTYTHQTQLRDPATRCAPEPCICPSPLRGRGECRVPAAPAAGVEATGTPGSPGIPARNGFNGVLRALVTGLFCHRHPRSKVLSLPGWAKQNSANLTPASGRQDHTTSPPAASSLVSALLIAHKSFDPPCDHLARKTLPRPPHPTPRP